jgi:magnesium-transporting ATPase (P-type)
MKPSTKITILTVLFMALILDTVMTFTMTLLNTGYSSLFLQRFALWWIVGFLVAFPTALIAMPQIRRLVAKIYNPTKDQDI